MRRRARRSTVVMLLLVMVLAGCGGGGGDGTAGGDGGGASETETTEAGGGGSESGGGGTEAGGTEGTDTGGGSGGTRTIEATTVTDASFDADVLQSGRPVLVHFWAEWCGPCRQLTPVLQTVAGEHEDTLTVARLNVDDNTEVPDRIGIDSIPTLVLFVDGAERERITGPTSKGEIDSALAGSIG